MESQLAVIYSSIITLLLGIVAFWLVRFVKRVDILSEIIERLNVTVTTREAVCGERHSIINARLKGHDIEIGVNRDRITKHETRIEIIEKGMKGGVS